MIADRIIYNGLKYLGTPYRFNARPYQSDAFDCSSFVQYLYGIYGIHLPRNSRDQYMRGKKVRYENLKKGDLLFFTTRQRKNNRGLSKIGHVGIYIGNHLMLHTMRRGNGVTVDKINDYWKGAFLGAKKVIHEADEGPELID